MEDQSKRPFRETLSALLRSNRRHVRYIQALVVLAALVAVAIPLAMRQSGMAMATTETRLNCQYAGSGAHAHNADCYDEQGNLVCPLAEKPFHTHGADCYATETVLACGQEEYDGHAHSEACYDGEGNLTCTLDEAPGHAHTDACYETRATDRLVCGMEETTEEHVHGPACFETVTVNVPDPAAPVATTEAAPAEDPNPEQEFSGVLKDSEDRVILVAQAKAPQGALPKGSTMRVEHVDLSKKDPQTDLSAQDKLNEALRREAGEDAAFVHEDAVDIAFYDAQGNRVDPAKKVEVRITTSMIRTFSDQRAAGDEAVANNGLLVLHVVDRQHTKRADAPDAEVIREAFLVNQNKDDRSTGHEDTILFETDEFSPFVVARVNNAASVPEAEADALQAEAEQETAVEDGASAQDATALPAQSFSHRIADTDGNQLLTVDVLAPEGAFPRGTTMQVKWVDASHIEEAVSQAVAERTDGRLVDLRAVDITFVDPDGNEIEPAKKITVTFTSDLIDTQDDSYVVHLDDQGKGEVVDALGAKELQRREMADQADELVIESDQFSTYVVAVTTLHKEMTASDGATYDITVDAPAEAGIPQDAELRVSEITEGDEGYDEYLAQALNALGEDTSSIRLARFFDIEIVSNGEEIEPQVPVRVDVQLTEVESLGTQISPNTVHFSGNSPSPEVIEANQSGDIASFDAAGFSVYGIIYTVDFHWDFNGQIYDFSIDGGDTQSLYELLTALSTVVPDVDDEFMSKIANVSFSDPSLIAVVKVDESTTAGQLKNALNISTQYSGQLRSDEREQMDAKQLLEGDWALITLKPFDTTESLTVTMDNGDSFVIQVTDAQVYADVLTADGSTYHIVITYDATAEIPEESELSAREIIPGSVEYDMYLNNAATQVGTAVEDIAFARFFDLEITHDGEKVEPKAPVQVSIEYANAMQIEEDEELNVVHFADDGAEVISDLEMSDNHKEVVYEQGSFSVTGTIVTPSNNTDRYMVLVNYPQGSNDYYIVNNDGTLTKVIRNNNGTVEVNEPMMWTMGEVNTHENGTGWWDSGRDYNYGLHLYYASEATDFNWMRTATDYYYKYIDPSAENGITEEKPGDVKLNGSGDNATAAQRYLASNSSIVYDNNNHTLRHDNNSYIGVQLDENGVPERIIGQQSRGNAASIVLAKAYSVPDVDQRHHTVNHIDISIESSAGITVPLAYGTYWYGDPTNPDSMHSFTVASDVDVDLEAEHISVSPDDMKRATIKAYDKNGEVHNAFVVTGYSSNAMTSFSTPQVRIEGRFKVANLNNDGDNNNWRDRRNRLDNIITYTVSVVKPITFDVKDEEHGQLYEKLADGTFRKVSVTVDINTTASFDYWDMRNECPAIRQEEGASQSATGFTEARWQSGEIDPSNLSGMDFVLGGDAEEANAKVVALEITKMVMDENHRLIKIAAPYSQGFEIYASNEKQQGTSLDDYMNVIGFDVPEYQNDYSHYDRYTNIHSKDVSVGTEGMGLVFDYDITPGMYYITEDPSTIPDEIVDIEGNTWTYVESRIETEYVWRNDQYSGRHVSATYTDKDSDTYQGIPEVAGVYTGSHNTPAEGQSATDYSSSTFEWVNPKTGVTETGTFRNGFLEFYVYNIYESGTKLEVEKQWELGSEPLSGTEVIFELLFRMRQIGQMVEDEMQPLPTPGDWTAFEWVKNSQGEGRVFKASVNTVLTLDSNSGWEGDFISLPKTYVDDEGKVYELDYDAEETSVKIPAPGKTVVDEDAIDVTNLYKVTKGDKSAESDYCDGRIVFTNTRRGLIFEKKWLDSSGSPIQAPTSSDLVVTGELWRKDITDSTTIQKVRDITLSQVNGWKVSISPAEMDAGWEYYIKGGTITETGASAIDYNFSAGPVISTDEDGNTVYSCTNQEKPTVNIDLLKADSETIGTSSIKYLNGATFYLTKVNGEGREESYNPSVFSIEDDSPVSVVLDGGFYKFTIPTVSGVKIAELKSGTYVLHEVSAPDGYNVTEGGWTFTVDVDNHQTPITNVTNADNANVTSDLANGITLTIPNPPGASLPEAGGPGTYLYTLCGLALFAAAGYIGFVSRRSSRKEVV